MSETHTEIHTETRDEPLDAEGRARRRLALAQMRRYGDPVLRMRAHEVENFDDDLRRLAERMTALMRDANGVGLAANQVGVLRRIFVMQPGEDAEVVTIVNPVVVSRSEETEADDEGCLSLPDVLAPVERATRLRLEGRDLDGGELALELEGLEARVAQHELDHLDGVLILDRTTKEARREALASLRPRPVLDLSG
ncbi:MAG: peptide deformylase [Gaiellaceae bacterium]